MALFTLVFQNGWQISPNSEWVSIQAKHESRSVNRQDLFRVPTLEEHEMRRGVAT